MILTIKNMDLKKALQILQANRIDARIRVEYGDEEQVFIQGCLAGTKKEKFEFLEIRIDTDEERALWLLNQ